MDAEGHLAEEKVFHLIVPSLPSPSLPCRVCSRLCGPRSPGLPSSQARSSPTGLMGNCTGKEQASSTNKLADVVCSVLVLFLPCAWWPPCTLTPLRCLWNIGVCSLRAAMALARRQGHPLRLLPSSARTLHRPACRVMTMTLAGLARVSVCDLANPPALFPGCLRRPRRRLGQTKSFLSRCMTTRHEQRMI